MIYDYAVGESSLNDPRTTSELHILRSLYGFVKRADNDESRLRISSE
jgi:hypothetical protein